MQPLPNAKATPNSGNAQQLPRGPCRLSRTLPSSLRIDEPNSENKPYLAPSRCRRQRPSHHIALRVARSPGKRTCPLLSMEDRSRPAKFSPRPKPASQPSPPPPCPAARRSLLGLSLAHRPRSPKLEAASQPLASPPYCNNSHRSPRRAPCLKPATQQRAPAGLSSRADLRAVEPAVARERFSCVVARDDTPTATALQRPPKARRLR